MTIIAVLVFSLGIYIEKFKQREAKDIHLQAKMEKWRSRWNPRIDFMENAIVWIFAILVIYYIYLG